MRKRTILSLFFCLPLTVGCSGSGTSGSGQAYAESICTCIKAVPRNEPDVEQCASLVQEAMTELKGSAEQSLAFRQALDDCQKDKNTTDKE